MLRRSYVIALLVTALCASVAVSASVTGQKDKQKEKAGSKEQKDKQKASIWTGADDSQAFIATTFGEGSYLGVFLEEVTPERVKELGLSEERGAIVMKVVEGGPAQKAGLKENDVIVAFNGRRVDSVRELQRLLGETPAERNVAIEVIRSGGRQTLNATLTNRSNEFRLLRPELAHTEAMTRAQEELSRSLEGLKRDHEKWQWTAPDFGNFAFVAPGQYGFFSGSRLGISVESLTEQLAEYFGVKEGRGVLVAHVDENGPGGKAGLKAGDVILFVDNQKVDTINELVNAVAKKEEGPVVLKILRNRSEQTVTVSLEKRGQAPGFRRRAGTRASAPRSV